MKQIGYADFIRVLNVHDPLDWVPGLEVRTDGIWVISPCSDDDCTPEERATLAEHPENDLSKPALPFPCDHQQLDKFLLWLGMPLEVFISEKWWPGQDLVKEYGLQGFQLFELLKDGVRARTITGLEVVNEDELERRGRESLAELERIEFLKEGAAQSGIVMTRHGFAGTRPPKRSDDKIRKAAQIAFEKQPKDVLVIPDGCEAISYSLSYDDDKKRMAAIFRAVGFLYNSADVIKYMWAHNIKPLESSPSPEQIEKLEKRSPCLQKEKVIQQDCIPDLTTMNAASVEVSVAKCNGKISETSFEEQKKSDQINAVNFFKKNPGEYWHVRFDEDGKDVMIKHLDGLLYISFLLEKPGSAISCQELYRAASGKEAANVMSEDVAISEGLNIGSGRQPVNDNKALAAIRREYANLQVELECTGMEEREKIEEKVEKIKPYLTTRDISDPNDKKAQVNVKKRLDTAYNAISKTGMTNLTRHLQDFIKPDGAFGLIYTGSLTWTINL